MATQQILWTVVPNGTSAGGAARLSIVVSPRLVPDTPAEALATASSDFAAWRTRTLTFALRADGEPAAVTVQAPPPTAQQTALWAELFKRATVQRFSFHDLSQQFLHALPVLNIAAFVKDLYGAIATDPATATQFPSVERLTTGPQSLRPLAFDWKIDADPDAPAGLRVTARDGTRPAERRFELAVAAAPGALAQQPSDPELDFWRLKAEHTPLSAPLQRTDPATQATFAGAVSVSQQIPTIDFHRAIALLGEHSWLMRELGLVFDLEIPLPAAPAGSVRVEAVTSDAPWAVEPLHLFAVTRYANGFIAAPRGNEQKGRMLDLSQPAYQIVDVEVDGAGQKLVNLADSVARSLTVKHRTHGTPDAFSLPTLRSAGLTLVRGGRALAIAQQAAETSAINTGLATTPPSLPLFAEDLTRGYRIDVLDEDAASPAWRSLVRRTGHYTLTEASAQWPADAELEDEAWASLAVTAAADDTAEHPDLHVREELVRWDGWSLGARRPGGHVGIDDGAAIYPTDGPDPEHPAHPDFPLWTAFRATPKSLPRLRFGRSYRVRARAVDIAGNSLPLAHPRADAATRSHTYRRYEPVPAPALALRELPIAGSSLERLVIRSANATPQLDAVATTDATERHVVPPLAGRDLCEQHGMFDGLTAQESWELIAAREGTLDMAANPLPGAAPFVDEGPSGVEAFDAKGATVSLASWQDGIVPSSVTVVHHEPQVALPYLPDALARGAMFVGEPNLDRAPFLGLPGAPPNTLTEHAVDGVSPVTQLFDKPEVRLVSVDFANDGDWPDLRPFRIRVVEGAAPPKWDAAQRVLQVALPKGQIARVRLSSVPRRDALELLALWRWLLDTGPSQSTRARLDELARRGRHWMLTPFRELELAHAVQQPLRTPDITLLGIRRAIGEKSATLVHDALTVHAWSTARVDVEASWSEPVDPVAEPSWKTIDGAAHAFDMTVAYPRPLGAADVDVHVERRHELGDTKHRMIAYRAVATTRFRECFKGTDEITRTSQPVTLSIPSSARPATPNVLYVVPTFGWRRTSSGPTTRESTRAGRGLRVYLERPWFSSGAGELLGVVVLTQRGQPAASIPPALSRLVTRWGADPVWASDVPQLAPGTSNFPRATGGTRHGLTLAELGDDAKITVSIAGHPVEFDALRRLWFADIEVNADNVYNPFIRLALARYQPNSVDEPAQGAAAPRNVHLSPVVLADFVQLTPDRSASVSQTSPTQLAVAVSGVGVGGNEIEIAVETRRADVADPELGWRPLPGVAVEKSEFANPFVPLAHFTVTLPQRGAAQSKRRRVVIREYELHLAGPDREDTQTRRRLVYADTFALT